MLFEPGGQLLAASVRDGAATLAVPIDARPAAVWFETTSVSGCHAWDSNFGKNYTFDARARRSGSATARRSSRATPRRSVRRRRDRRSGFSFDTWARQRAAITNLCFEVYQPGMTDHDDPDLWQKLDTELHWRSRADEPGPSRRSSFDRRVGNNARYAFGRARSIRSAPYHCPEVAGDADARRHVPQISVEYYIVVNGGELGPSPARRSRARSSTTRRLLARANCH